jgi:hypothetical protein
MRERDRHDSESLTRRAPEPPLADGDDTQPLLDDGAALLAAADEAIGRALSGNSAEFLRQNRQQGGQ